jgi:hypothetical protein
MPCPRTTRGGTTEVTPGTAPVSQHSQSIADIKDETSLKTFTTVSVILMSQAVVSQAGTF